MKKLKVGLLIFLIFVVGFTGGVVVSRAFFRHTVATMVNDPDRMRKLIARRMNRQLRLDAEQRLKVDAILQTTQTDLKALRHDFSPRFHRILSNTQTEISGILTPEQQERFRKFREENQRLWQERER